MSKPRSDADAEFDSSPKRPADHAEATGAEVSYPRLGVKGWLRWSWRQLTSMRTALVLLLLLALAAVPGSIVPQRSSNPNGVIAWFDDDPELYRVLDALQLFDVYTSVWFSAIYILLFISLIGCILPRTKHHLKALRAKPPRTPANLARLADYEKVSVVAQSEHPDAAAEALIESATKVLRKEHYRVERYDSDGSVSVSAERGYLRETGNLVFHAALVGVLLSVGVGAGFSYTGQAVIVEGDTFVNSALDYNTLSTGPLVSTEQLPLYTLRLDRFDLRFINPGEPGQGQAVDFAAQVTTQLPGEEAQEQTIRVNHPLNLAGERIYLMGNGYAPHIQVRNSAGDLVFEQAVPFLPQDNNLSSLGVIKVADGMPEQLGFVGFLYPTAAEMHSGALTSMFGQLLNPVMTLNMFAGDLGINDGTPRSVYTLDPSDMEQLAGGESGVAALELVPGQTVDLPDDLGTITFVDDADISPTNQAVLRFVSLSMHRDVSATGVLIFSLLALAGLMAALFVPRRRMWVKATPSGDGVVIEYAGLARGEDPQLPQAVERLVKEHRAASEILNEQDPE